MSKLHLKYVKPLFQLTYHTLTSSQTESHLGYTGSKTLRGQHRLRTQITNCYKALGYTTSFDLPQGEGVNGEVDVHKKTVRFSGNQPDVKVMLHELGHVIDFHLRDAEPGGWAKILGREKYDLKRRFEKGEFDEEMLAIGLHAYPYYRPINKETFSADDFGVLADFYEDYVFLYEETFANCVSICLTFPDKSRTIAPLLSIEVMNFMYSDPKIREIITSLDGWELGTTDET